MEKFSTENLILLEFLVDRVSLDEDVNENLGNIGGETCVSFQFLDNAPLYVCEEDFAPKRKYARDQGTLKNGKSCLFSLTPKQAEDATKQFDIYVTIFKKMLPGVLPDKIQIGESLISIVNLFNELVESIATRTEETSPAAKTLKDCFKIAKPTGETIGHIAVYIRMSCFGKLIVTQFQMDLEDKSVQFKAKEGHYLFRYNKQRKDQIDMSKNTGEFPMRNNQCPTIPCNTSNPMAMMHSGGTEQSQPQMPPSAMGACAFMGGGMGGTPACAMPPEPMCGSPCPQMMQQMGAGYPSMGPMVPYGYNMPQQPMGQSNEQPGCFQEIGAQMGGNALTIRVHKDKNKLEQVDSEDDCECGSGSTKKKKTKPPSDTASGSCPGSPQNVNMMPGVPAGNQKLPFEFKMAGCGQAANNNVTVVPPVCTAPDGTQFTELSDPNRDVFILRIGKKSEGVAKKSNLELELCTPKGLDTKPPPKKETRDTQYDPKDAEAEKGGKAGKAGKGGKAKGGKGKGGKGKGKKKK